MVVYEFEEEEKAQALTSKKRKRQSQVMLMLLILGVGAFYYFTIYLPQEEVKKYNEILSKITNSRSEKEVDELNKEINNLDDNLLPKDKKKASLKQVQNHQKKQWEKSSQDLENEAYQKGRIWELPVKNWADLKVKAFAGVLLNEYLEEAGIFPGQDKNPNFSFSRSASYEIYFPLSLKEHYDAGKSVKQTNCLMLGAKEDLILSDKIEAWYRSVVTNPVRGDMDRGENNALFHGMTRTGKSATVRNVCFQANKYPLVIIKGSSLTPRIKSKLKVDEKFAYTISELEWTLEKTYCLPREANGEIRYVLFVDECNQISNNAMTFDAHLLQFIKEHLEGNKSSRKQETDNLWVMATNHLNQLEEAVYQAGRLANPLNFSWTWKEFLKHAEKSGIYNQLPERWKKDENGGDIVLTSEEDKWVKKFNIPIFYKDFIGNDEKQPNKPKFWNLFISKNPNAILKTEIKKLDDQGNETNEVERIDENEIEIGEFLEYFWNLQESGNIDNYAGSFESLKQIKVEDVLDGTLPEMVEIMTGFSNDLSEKLENLRQEIEGLNQQLQASSAVNSNGGLQSSINDIYRLIGDLRAKVDNR